MSRRDAPGRAVARTATCTLAPEGSVVYRTARCALSSGGQSVGLRIDGAVTSRPVAFPRLSRKALSSLDVVAPRVVDARGLQSLWRTSGEAFREDGSHKITQGKSLHFSPPVQSSHAPLQD